MPAWHRTSRAREHDILLALELAEEKEDISPDFWDFAAPGTAKVIHLIDPYLTHGLDTHKREQDLQEACHQLVREIQATYTKAWHRGGSYLEARRLDDQFIFLIEILKLETTATRKSEDVWRQSRKTVVEALEKLRSEMHAIMQ